MHLLFKSSAFEKTLNFSQLLSNETQIDPVENRMNKKRQFSKGSVKNMKDWGSD